MTEKSVCFVLVLLPALGTMETAKMNTFFESTTDKTLGSVPGAVLWFTSEAVVIIPKRGGSPLAI